MATGSAVFTALANVPTNTVTWNGAIPAGGSVTITIQALIEANVTIGSSITNQGTVNYDADGNGTDESTTVTDDPSQPGTGSTASVVASATNAIPALDPFAMATLLAALGLLVMRRS